LSKDHKPDLPEERKRVVAAGHYVEDGRVDGVIAISKAIGDWEYKSPKLAPEKMAVSAFPDVTKTAITKDTDFLICACDGIWDCMTSQQACDFVKKGRSKLVGFGGGDLNLQKQVSNSSVKSNGSKGAGKAKVGKVGAKEGKMEATRDNSKFKGLAVVVEMVMEQNCPASIHQSDGLGCDNMTCILVQFSKTENRDN
jgi:serine/threonine protein phosphatase PrpC